jgi:hypothetical protein
MIILIKIVQLLLSLSILVIFHGSDISSLPGSSKPGSRNSTFSSTRGFPFLNSKEEKPNTGSAGFRLADMLKFPA